MELKGTFAPPAMGNTAVPIPMVGEGALNLTEASLEVQGYKKPFNPLVLLIPVGVIGAIFFYAVVATALNLPSWLTKSVAMGIVGAVVVFGLSRRQGAGKNATPWTLSIPWTSVNKAHEDPQAPGALVIHVKKFSPKGTLHFVPAEKTSILTMVNEVERRCRR